VSPFSVVFTYLLTGLLHGCCTERCGTQLPLVAYLRSSPYLHRNDTTHGGFSVYGLLEEVVKSAEEISEIVKAVKTYSYLDQAPIQEVDIRESLENTLVILRSKIKAGISITRDYADDVPRVEAYGSELNQVWTNIINNAIDAMQGQGELVLRIYTEDRDVSVDIIDNGSGIPLEVQPRIFEPFFTTKAPGAGTGLGLHIAYNIIVHKHHGQIQVASKPGETHFRVVLPVQLNSK
jgi:signal transduction histidine kinase